jgi:hypothetical protein
MFSKLGALAVAIVVLGAFALIGDSAYALGGSQACCHDEIGCCTGGEGCCYSVDAGFCSTDVEFCDWWACVVWPDMDECQEDPV